MNQTDSAIEILESISTYASRYDIWLCDIWGVIHNGLTKHQSATRACSKFRDQGGTVIFITNAPRPRESIQTQLQQLDVPDTAYDNIVTSGDVTRHLLLEYSGQSVFHLGPERDRPIFDGLELNLRPLDNADVVLCSGLYDDQSETPEDYAALLQDISKLQLPMICANPDLVVERGQQIVYCAGALAEAYSQLGGNVMYAGKPHSPIYDRALELASNKSRADISRDRVLAIGDGLKTDMAGANNASIDALFVASGVHLKPDQTSSLREDIVDLFAGADFLPIAAQLKLDW